MAGSHSHAEPPKIAVQFDGGPPAGDGSAQRYQSRFGLSRDERDSTNQGCSTEVWQGTRSMSSRSPRSWQAAIERVEVGERAELGGDVGVVGDVVAEVGERAGVDGAEPDRVDAQGGIGPAQVVEAPEDAGEVADAVAVRIGEAAWVDLVEDGALPPSVAHERGF